MFHPVGAGGTAPQQGAFSLGGKPAGVLYDQRVYMLPPLLAGLLDCVACGALYLRVHSRFFALFHLFYVLLQARKQKVTPLIGTDSGVNAFAP